MDAVAQERVGALKAMICGGGTAGHVYPGLALADALEVLTPGIDILFVGAEGGLESTLLPRLGLPLRTLRVQGLPRGISLKAVRSLVLMGRAFFSARRMLAEERPDVVIGLGGFAALPVAYAAWRRGLPVVVHEQNSVPGLVNKFLATRATAVGLTYPDAAQVFGGKGKVIGNPVRPQIAATDQAEARKRLGLDADRECVLVLGGSRGAKSVNEAALDMYDVVRGDTSLQVLIITGSEQFREAEDILASKRLPGDKVVYRLIPYLDDIALAYSAADMAVSRAGSGAISELAICGRPCLLVPYPWATDDHQRKNAEAMVSAGAAVIIDNDELSGRSLWESASLILRDAGRLREMSAAALRFAKPEAAIDLAKMVLSAARPVWPPY